MNVFTETEIQQWEAADNDLTCFEDRERSGEIRAEQRGMVWSSTYSTFRPHSTRLIMRSCSNDWNLPMDSLGRFFLGCARSWQTENSVSSSMDSLRQHRPWVSVFLRGVSLGRCSSYSTRRIYSILRRNSAWGSTVMRMMDSCISTKRLVSALPPVLSKVATCITEIDRGMNSNRLKLNSDKTQFIWLGSRHELLKVSIDSIDLGSCEVKFRDSVNNLGVVIDGGQLSMKDHVQKVCKTCYYHLRQLRSISSGLTEPAFKKQLKTFLFRTVKSALMSLRNGLSIRSFNL